MSGPADAAELDRVESDIDAWLADQLVTNPILVAVDRGEPGERRWYVRLRGEDKDFSTIWFRLHQRTLRYETYVMPAPEENHQAFYEYLLRRNADLYGVQFCIGEEDAVFLVGRLPIEHLTDAELDRVIGTVWATVERCFRSALRVGFASRLGA